MLSFHLFLVLGCQLFHLFRVPKSREGKAPGACAKG